MTVISISIKQYFLMKGDERSKDLLFMTPVNFREPPKKLNEFEFCNRFAIMPLDLPLVTDFENGLKAVKQTFDVIKHSSAPLAVHYLGTLMM